MTIHVWRKYVAAVFYMHWTVAVAADENLVPKQLAIPATYFGTHFHRATTTTRVPDHGVGSWRLWDARVAWRYLEPKSSTANFQELDKIISIARARQISLLYTFGATPEWASARPEEKGSYGPGSVAEPRDINDWTTFVRQIATRYRGQIEAFEIWNEPNAGFFTGSPVKMAELTCAAYRILKAIDANNIVVAPSPVGGWPNQLKWFDEFLSADVSQCFDVVGYHFYAAKDTPEKMLATISSVRKILSDHAMNDHPIWNTEAGWRLDVGPSDAPAIDASWPKLNAEQSAAYVARALIIGWAAGLDRYYWYSWDHNDMGFVRTNGSETPSAAGYLATARWLTGWTMRSCRSAKAVWVCEMARDSESAWIVWREDGATEPWQPPIEIHISKYETLAEAINPIQSRELPVGISPIRLLP